MVVSVNLIASGTSQRQASGHICERLFIFSIWTCLWGIPFIGLIEVGSVTLKVDTTISRVCQHSGAVSGAVTKLHDLSLLPRNLESEVRTRSFGRRWVRREKGESESYLSTNIVCSLLTVMWPATLFICLTFHCHCQLWAKIRVNLKEKEDGKCHYIQCKCSRLLPCCILPSPGIPLPRLYSQGFFGPSLLLKACSRLAKNISYVL